MIDLVFYLAIGAIACISAGLLGLGGGLVIVPALLFVFKFHGLPADSMMHIAVGTSLMAIMLTSLSSMLAHHRQQNVDWHLVKNLLVSLLAGGFLGAYCATAMSSALLQQVFAIYALLMAIRLWFPISHIAISESLLSRPYLMVSGTLIGGVSAVVGMGGGTMIVPYLVLARQPIQKAIGTSAACAFPIATAGVVGFYVFAHNNAQANVPGQFGFINWLAFLGITSTSVIFAPLAAKLAKRLPVVRLQQLFSMILMVVAIDMFF